jgi:hypothetical protein
MRSSAALSARCRRSRMRSSSRSTRRRFPNWAMPPASPSACRTVPASAMMRCWPRATSCWAWPRKSKVLAGVRPEGLEDTPQLQVDIDRDKANALGVSFADINATLSTASARPMSTTSECGSPAAGDRAGRCRGQAAAGRHRPAVCEEQRRRHGAVLVVSSTLWNTGPVQLVRYNGYPAMKLAGNAAPGRSTGEAMDRDGAPGLAAADRLRLSNGPASRWRKRRPARRRRRCLRCRCWRCSWCWPRCMRAPRFRWR